MFLAEGVGFEPTDLSINCFQDSSLKPLGHPSNLGLAAGIEPATCCLQGSGSTKLSYASLMSLPSERITQDFEIVKVKFIAIRVFQGEIGIA